MNDKDKKSNEIVVEPVFDEISILPEHEEVDTYAMIPTEIPTEIVDKDIVLTGAPKTNHFWELMNELNHSNYYGSYLLSKLHRCKFAYGLLLNTKLTVPGVWEVGETANYEVKVYNSTGFELKKVRAYLHIKDSGSASIVSPPGNYLEIGDIPFSNRKTTTFKVKGVKAGDVSLNLRIDGHMGSLKYPLYYDGKHWNGSKWIYKHPYRVKYHIYG